MVAACCQLDWCAALRTAFVFIFVFVLKFIEINHSDQIVLFDTKAAPVPRFFTSEAVDLSTLCAHAPFTLAPAFRTLDLRHTIRCWTPLLILVRYDVLDIV